MADIVLLHSPTPKLEKLQMQCFDSGAREFISKLHNQFDEEIDLLYKNRQRRNVAAHTQTSFEKRHLDLGDVSASNTAHFVSALNSDVQGIQVDFDDGHCPTWRNQLMAYNNIYWAVHDTQKLPGGPLSITTCPINGKEAPGALIDFGILMYHNARRLHETGSGPYFYLSKLEGAGEARLWNDMFVWTQRQLGLPRGAVRACVLIENIFSVFELDEILYALREHSLGLNCDREEFILPDRSKYVSMEQHFLSSYMRLVVCTAHARGAPATGGMAARMLTRGLGAQDSRSWRPKRRRSTLEEKQLYPEPDTPQVQHHRNPPRPADYPEGGCDHARPRAQRGRDHHVRVLLARGRGTLLPPGLRGGLCHGRDIPLAGVAVAAVRGELRHTPRDLLTIRGGRVTIMFVYYWLEGAGHYFHHDCVEDSATAEISRWQVWQWLRFGGAGHYFHQDCEEDSATAEISRWQVWQWLRFGRAAAQFAQEAHRSLCRSAAERKRLSAARHMSTELFQARHPPEYITTYLNDNHKFRALNNKALAKSHL
ncbi:Uncharacterized protein OBRU01_10532 [Operophtera brumata]|uniref:malate synthase n=1 Tax=Operophtera brumata TaxID=104452 RepID=A0A0L7L7F2_OPEBR|nr:Uncharacterized protein OBRU01_10532 [Operophtera brumata]